MLTKIKNNPIFYLGGLALIVLILAFPIMVDSSPKITITYNSHNSDLPYVLINERVMVPVRAAVEILGAKVDYNSDLQKITITRANNKLELEIGSKILTVNGTPRPMDEAPFIKDGNLMAHIKIVEYGLGSFLEWDQENFAVNIWDNRFVGTDKMKTIVDNISFGKALAPPLEKVSITLPNGAIYQGTILSGEFHGDGKITYQDGSYYIGGWKEGLYEGYGSYQYSNGDYYKGSFKEGKYHGNGTYTYSNKTTIEGQWEYGKCITTY